ncbi:MAG TPA: 2,3-bisphosphoglycerate-independent phosphoglycerate mutase [Ruminococcaceae bacterium]|nr:2,3-bisphosphoglycerate-independent phosphoglycerate mutase [Oscillospiraceae bacterium]
MKKPIALIIMDGFGLNPAQSGNAVKAAKTPCIDALMKEYPNTSIGASGMDVGLPAGQMGNSEVGHTNIGAGRVVYQELTRISKAIDDGEFAKNPKLLAACENCRRHGTALHLMGLVSDGGVHSHNTHLYALLRMAKNQGIKKVYVHCFLDGRDVPPASGADFIDELQKTMYDIGAGKIATVMGRYYAMDRDNRWERVAKAYAAMVYGEGIKNPDAADAVRKSYEEIDEEGKHITDEFVIPVVCDADAVISHGDSVVFFNFRPDRAREITRTLVDPDFDGFPREKGFFPLFFVCMTQYDADMPDVHVAFTPQSLQNTFGEYISESGLTQLRIAETEKYAHVTFFFNGGVEQPYNGEDRVLVPSPKVATYDLKPEMSAFEVCDKVCERIMSGKYDVIILNYANCDMVGHTGIFDAAVKAVEAVDACVGRTAEALAKMGGIALITADHGNAEQMTEPDGSPFTAHTTNPVPLIVTDKNVSLRSDGRLCDLSPTMLKLLNLPQPKEMDGVSLII